MLLIKLLITILAIFAMPYFVSGIAVSSVLTAVIVGVCLTFLNMVVKPIVSLLTLPLNIITLGLFSLIINGAFFWFVAQIISGFTVANFTSALIGALIISIINWIVNHFVD
jgi:putative membrane protein